MSTARSYGAGLLACRRSVGRTPWSARVPLDPLHLAATFLLVLLCAPSLPAQDLQSVKRICVEKFGPTTQSLEAREMLLSSLFAAKRFSVTENCEKADAVLKGTASERSSQRMRSEGDSATVRRGAARNAIGAVAGSVGDSERIFSSEMQRHATVTLRLVTPDGDLIWAHTAESSGGKAKSALSDAVDRAIQRLVRDLDHKKPHTEPVK